MAKIIKRKARKGYVSGITYLFWREEFILKFKNALQSLKEKTIGKSPGKKIKLSNKRVIGAAVVAFVTVLTVV